MMIEMERERIARGTGHIQNTTLWFIKLQDNIFATVLTHAVELFEVNTCPFQEGLLVGLITGMNLARC